ncbi:MAG: ribosome small subunit-dependent GTPase A [Burkholderiales bacterium]|nr:ribosome small subunit-dependent GTPase A [Anaerolineae bacterium]
MSRKTKSRHEYDLKYDYKRHRGRKQGKNGSSDHEPDAVEGVPLSLHMAADAQPTMQGVVYRKSTGFYFVRPDDNDQGESITCTISSRLRKHLIYPQADESSLRHRVVDVKDIKAVDPVAVGDHVVYVDAGEGAGMITEILPRTNALTRAAPGPKPLEQVIVSNVDQVVVVFAAAQPPPNWNMLDRYLASAEACEIPVLICITKTDVANMDELRDELAMYEALGYPIVLTSSNTGEGIDTLKEAVVGKSSALVGKSGVGKTSLLNALQPELGLRVNEVNTRMDKGRHTTTHLEMFSLDAGGSVVDTPGMKLFGLWNVEPQDLAMLFVDIGQYAGACRFGPSCTHVQEPGCAVRRAIEFGQVSQRRYESYLYMREYLNTHGE